MSKPTPGKTYTVVTGDQLRLIAGRAYGIESDWRIIFDANETTLKSGDPNIIFPGEVIFIPLKQEIQELVENLERDRFNNKDDDEFTLLLNGEEVPVKDGRLVKTMDTVVSAATASLSWIPGKDKKLDKALIPYSYPEALVYLGNKLKLTGFLYNTLPTLSPNSSVIGLEIFSKTADFMDSTMKAPYEKSKVTLLQRAQELAQQSSIRAILDDGVDDGGQFDRMTSEPTDTRFAHIQKYASQRSILLTDTVDGDLLLTQAKVKSKSIGTLQEEEFNAKEFKIKYDGRKRFNIYKAIGPSPGGVSKTETSKDDNVPRSRYFTFKTNDATKGNQKNAADWRRNKEFAKSLTIPIPVSSWYGPDGKLWEENTIVTVISKSLFIPNGFDLMIRQVEFIDKSDGTDAVLSMIPPQAYTNEKITDPWEVSA